MIQKIVFCIVYLGILVTLCMFMYEHNFERTDYEYFPIKINKNISTSTQKHKHFVTYFTKRNNENEETVPSIIINNIASYNFGKLYFFTNTMCDDFMKNFDERVYRAYKNLIPKAFQSDLWRLCVLYKYGGLYTDISLKMVEPVNFFVDFDIVLCEDTNQGDIYNAILFFKYPKHPLLKYWIDNIVLIVEQKKYGDSPLDVTGPTCLGRFIRNFYPIQFKRGINFYKNEKILYLQCKYIEHNIFEMKYNTKIVDENNKTLLQRNKDYKYMKDYFSKKSKTNSYHELWYKKKVFC